MDAATLSKAMGGTLPMSEYQRLLPGMENAMRAAGITTPLRAAHWCAQIGHESLGLRYMEEIASGAAYNGRADLGNTQPGDGQRFKGSGPIQLTGRFNFRKFTQWANSEGYTNLNFETRPELVRQDPKWGFLAASWYWVVARPNLNSQCDRDDVVAVTRSINGGTNGLADRRSRLARCKSLGSKILPSGASTGTGGGTVGLDYYNVQPHATKLTKSYTAGRNGKTINAVFRHHMAGNLNLDQCVNLWDSSRAASAHYTVNSTGGIGQAVYDSNTAWATGNTEGNQRGISIEHANITRQVGGSDSNRGSWNISDATIINGARLAAALCLYYKLGRPVYGKNIKDHRDVRQTFCPGHLANGGMYHNKWMAEAQSFYDKLVAKSVNPDGTPKKGKVEDDMFSDNDRLMLAEIRNQLTGSHDTKKFPGWKQLGDKSVTDALADVRNEVRQIGDQLAGYERDDRGARKFSGWPNIDGNGGKTIVEALAEVQKAVKSIQDSIEKGS